MRFFHLDTPVTFLPVRDDMSAFACELDSDFCRRFFRRHTFGLVVIFFLVFFFSFSGRFLAEQDPCSCGVLVIISLPHGLCEELGRRHLGADVSNLMGNGNGRRYVGGLDTNRRTLLANMAGCSSAVRVCSTKAGHLLAQACINLEFPKYCIDP